jgi:2-polyprenyl-6-methoxyphenol hydroxylase-like FAD-dependent oxidoreductase
MQVTIAGGGVAGTVCAIALRRIGADVTVYEAYPDPAGSIGSFLSLASNGLRALDAVGCRTDVQARGPAVPLQRIWSGEGRLLGENPRGRRADDPVHSVTLRRADLVKTLRDTASAAGARIVTGERVVAADDTGDRIRVHLASGNTTDSDLLVGADGIWSTVRTILDANAPHPDYAGLYSVSGTATLDTAPGIFNMTIGRGGAFIHLDAGDGTVWWSAQVADPTRPDPGTVDLALLRDKYRHEDQVLDVLRHTTAMQRPTLDHVLAPVPAWRGDRIVLVGDAAHPVGAGQGASMAIEDVVVLAQRLAAHPVPAALAAYETARRPRITKMLKAGHDNRAMKTRGPLRRRLGDSMMSFGLKHFYDKATGWLYTYDVGPLPVPA